MSLFEQASVTRGRNRMALPRRTEGGPKPRRKWTETEQMKLQQQQEGTSDDEEQARRQWPSATRAYVEDAPAGAGSGRQRETGRAPRRPSCLWERENETFDILLLWGKAQILPEVSSRRQPDSFFLIWD